MAKIVILGAGLTGISAAYHLEQAGFYEYALFEKETIPGGLCRSVQQDGFTFDMTGHLLHVNDPYFSSLIQDKVGLDAFEQINRRSFIYSNNAYTPYPFQTNLRGLPLDVIAECLSGFVKRRTDKQIKTFKQWVLHQFGAGFGKHFFFPYQKKIFSYPINKLTASWTGRFVPATTLNQILEGIMHDAAPPSIGYNAQFLYPKKGGIFFWVQKLAQQLINPVHTSYSVKTIDSINNIVHFTNGHKERYETLINTIPLDLFLCMLKESSSSNLKQAARHLLCNSVINFNIGVNRSDLCDKHWIYFPETQYAFYRLGFPHNFSTHTVPAGCSSLYGEYSFLKKDPTNNQITEVITQTKRLLKISDTDIATELIIPISHAYVIYNSWRDKYLPTLLEQLKEKAIHSVGRYGQWKYSSMQEAILDGQEVARIVLE